MTNANTNMNIDSLIDAAKNEVGTLLTKYATQMRAGLVNNLKQSFDVGIGAPVIGAAAAGTPPVKARRRGRRPARAVTTPSAPVDLGTKILSLATNAVSKSAIYSGCGRVSRAKIDRTVAALVTGTKLRQLGAGRMTTYQAVPGAVATHAVN